MVYMKEYKEEQDPSFSKNRNTYKGTVGISVQFSVSS